MTRSPPPPFATRRLPARRPEPGLMHRMVVPLLAALAAAGAGPARRPAADRPDPAAVEFFEARVRPVLVAHCLGCHGPQKQKAGLRLDSREALMKGGEAGPVVVPGDPAGSSLIEAVGYE